MTQDLEKNVSMMEERGFHIIHDRKDSFEPGDVEITMEDSLGHRMDIVRTPRYSEEQYVIRVNVDRFDEALELYEKEGYTVFAGPNTTESAKMAVISSESGLKILLMEHLRKK